MSKGELKGEPKDRWVEFGVFVKERREAITVNRKPMGITEACRRSGISRTQWYEVEAGEVGTDRERLKDYARALELSPGSTEYFQLYSLAGFAPPQTFEEIVGASMGQTPASLEELLTRQGLTPEQAQRVMSDVFDLRRLNELERAEMGED